MRLTEGAVPKAESMAEADLAPSNEGDYQAVRDLGFGEGDALTLRTACPTSAIASTTAALEALGPSRVLVRPLAREVRATWEMESLPDTDALGGEVGRLRAGLAESGGALIGERIPEELRAALNPWGRSANFGRMAAVKAAFDPDGRLNAGRYVGGL